ncbi:hypothetical protein Tco_0607873, partial [Tanacetum coccineum]
FLLQETAEETLARERQRKARTILLMALPEDHLAKFHKMIDAKDMWEAIKSRFGGNDEYKKMQEEPMHWLRIRHRGRMSQRVGLIAPIIEEYESDSEDEYVSIPTKEQATPTYGKEFSYPLIADSLLKNYMVSTHHTSQLKSWPSPKANCAHELAILGQTATGKESSNPFMAGSLPKTIHFCDSLQSDEDSLELIKLLILSCTNFLTYVLDLRDQIPLNKVRLQA